MLDISNILDRCAPPGQPRYGYRLFSRLRQSAEEAVRPEEDADQPICRIAISAVP